MKKLPTAILVLAAAAVLAAPQVPAAETSGDGHWPSWRGPLGNGVSPHGDPPSRWSDAENIRFKVAVPGRGLASPVIWGDRIFLLSAVAMDDAAYAESQKIALLVIEPRLSAFRPPESEDVDELFAAMQAELAREPRGGDVVVIHKLRGEPGDGARDLIDGLLADPEIRRQAASLLRDPGVRDTARKLAAENPDVARKAMDFLRKKGF